MFLNGRDDAMIYSMFLIRTTGQGDLAVSVFLSVLLFV